MFWHVEKIKLTLSDTQVNSTCLTSISEAELLSPSILTSRDCRADSRSSMAVLELSAWGSDSDTLLMWYYRRGEQRWNVTKYIDSVIQLKYTLVYDNKALWTFECFFSYLFFFSSTFEREIHYFTPPTNTLQVFTKNEEFGFKAKFFDNVWVISNILNVKICFISPLDKSLN